MSRRKGFTLVELVIVIMILGVLAAVALPKFTSTSATAADNGLKQSLGVVRGAIDLYASQNNGTYPGAAGTEAGFKADIAAHLRGASFPACPIGAKNNQVDVVTTTPLTGQAAPTKGWRYNYQTGEFIANSNAATKSDATVTYDAL